MNIFAIGTVFSLEYSDMPWHIYKLQPIESFYQEYSGLKISGGEKEKPTLPVTSGLSDVNTKSCRNCEWDQRFANLLYFSLHLTKQFFVATEVSDTILPLRKAWYETYMFCEDALALVINSN